MPSTLGACRRVVRPLISVGSNGPSINPSNDRRRTNRAIRLVSPKPHDGGLRGMVLILPGRQARYKSRLGSRSNSEDCLPKFPPPERIARAGCSRRDSACRLRVGIPIRKVYEMSCVLIGTGSKLRINP